MAETLMLTTGLLVLAFAGIGIGALFGRKSIKGSCGGVAGQDTCSTCGQSSCEKEEAGLTR